MKKLTLILAMMLVLGLTANAQAALVTIGVGGDGGGTSLYQIYNTFYGTALLNNAALPQNDSFTGPGVFTSSSGTIGGIARYAGYDLNLYAIDGGTTHLGFWAGGTIAPTTSYFGSFGPISVGVPFTMRGDTLGGSWVSGLALDGEYHFVVIDHPTDATKKFIGFEDKTTANGSDWDYNDFVFEITNVGTPVIPEPMSMLLFGMGILGLVGLKKKS